VDVINIERKFKYNSVSLPDPNPDLSADQVREFYATQFPELNNAVVEGPVTKDKTATWTFTRAAGAKGMKPVRTNGMPAKDVVKAAMASPVAGLDTSLALAAAAGQHQVVAGRIAAVASTRRVNVPTMPLPSTAFGVWG
jgi:PRTRC genetic system protein C